MILKDGTGRGYQVKIDSDNRMHTSAVTRQEVERSIYEGDGYNLNTGLVNITDANSDNAVWYLKNNDDEDIIVHEILIILGTTTGGTGDGTLKVFRNPTGGTIISNALPVEALVNRNFSSSNIIEVETYKGATGHTLTGGVTLGSTNRAGSAVVNFTSTPFLLAKGNSIGITWAGATGNTAQSVRVAVTIFTANKEV